MDKESFNKVWKKTPRYGVYEVTAFEEHCQLQHALHTGELVLVTAHCGKKWIVCNGFDGDPFRYYNRCLTCPYGPTDDEFPSSTCLVCHLKKRLL